MSSLWINKDGQEGSLLCLFRPVGSGISKIVDKTSEAFCFHKNETFAQPLTCGLFRNLVLPLSFVLNINISSIPTPVDEERGEATSGLPGYKVSAPVL